VSPTGPRIAVLDYGIGNLRSAEKALQHVGAAARLVTDPTEVEAADAVVLPGVGAFGACARALRESGLEKVARAAIAADVPFLAVCIGFQLLYEGSDEISDEIARTRAVSGEDAGGGASAVSGGGAQAEEPGGGAQAEEPGGGAQAEEPGGGAQAEEPGLGIFPGRVTALAPTVKHPQMQWNQLIAVGAGAGAGAGADGAGSEPASLRGLGPRPWVYFVHSFAPPVGSETVAVCDYGGPVAALVERGNLWGAQFHPEKSGRSGLAMLANFVARAA
jgi:glutamine amidotransferase